MWFWPNSIKVRTALILSVLVTILWLGAAGITARILSNEMGNVFDAALQETGQRILQLAVIEVLGRDEDGNSQLVTALDSGPEFFTYMVRDDLGQVLLSSQNAVATQFPQGLPMGFSTLAQARLYQEAAVSGSIILTIAEPLAHRRTVAREVALALSLPLLLVIPLSIIGISYGLGFGLGPLGQLQGQLAQREIGDLASLQTDDLPRELQPIAMTANQLFARLKTAFDAERSFASNAAHELRTPLAGAVAQVQRLRQLTQEPETMRRADQIEVTLKRLTRLSERLVQLARAEGAQLIAASPSDMCIILRWVAEDFSHGSDMGRLRMDLPDQTVLSTLDPDAVGIVARNLFENALRHGDGGQVRVHLGLDGWLRVENDGPAVADPAALAVRFMRMGGLGSGLGLAIVRTIADRAGIAMTLTSPLAGQTGGFCALIQLRADT